MNKTDIIRRVSDVTGFTATVVEEVLNAQTDAATAALKTGEDVVLHGLGKLKPKARKAREGRNPGTGETIQIAAKTVVGFTAAKSLADQVK